MQKSPFVCVLLVCWFSGVQAQTPTLSMKTPRFDTLTQEFVIEYQIDDPIRKNGNKRRIYDYTINLYYDQGGEKIGPLQKLEGHWGDELLAGDSVNTLGYTKGTPKIIRWDFLKEHPEFDGTNTQFRLDVQYEPSVLELGGPGAFWRSIILPGWGIQKVYRRDRFKWRWMINSAAYLSFITAGVVLHGEADNRYDEYLNSTNSISESERHFDAANNTRLLANGMFVAAAGIMISDIVRVILKGKKNRIEQQKLLEKNQQMDEKFLISFSTNQVRGIPTFGLAIRF